VKQRAQARQVVARHFGEEVVLEVIVLVQQQKRDQSIASNGTRCEKRIVGAREACLAASARTAEM